MLKVFQISEHNSKPWSRKSYEGRSDWVDSRGLIQTHTGGLHTLEEQSYSGPAPCSEFTMPGKLVHFGHHLITLIPVRKCNLQPLHCVPPLRCRRLADGVLVPE
jgi:hypothetical protein